MTELLASLQAVMSKHYNGMNPAELRIGTVTAISPLKITLVNTTAPLPEALFYLTESVIEKKITIEGHTHDRNDLTHTHDAIGLSHQHPLATGSTGTALSGAYTTTQALTGIYTTLLERENIFCTEHGERLPIETDGNGNTVVILNRGLAVGDKVLMLRVMGGQQFIILSRVFEHKEG